jgi:hypothetical protein
MLLKFAMIGVGLYGFAMPLLRRLGFLAGRPRFELAIPPLFLSSAFFVLAAYQLGRLVLFPRGFFGVEPNGTLTRFGEWPEFCLSLAFAAYAFLVWRRLQTDAFETKDEALAAATVPPPSPHLRDGLQHARRQAMAHGPTDLDEPVAGDVDEAEAAQRDPADVVTS